MSKVDWSLAPGGATHYGVVSSNRICWYIVRDDGRYDYAYQNDGYPAEKWMASGGRPGYQPLIERPQPKPWSGPEDGLPPVGEIVEYNGFSSDLKPGSRVEIIHHFSAGVADAAAFLYYKSGGRYVSQAIAAYFKPVSSSADIAADKRESSIRELMDIAQVDCRVTAARLVDAGFKREVV